MRAGRLVNLLLLLQTGRRLTASQLAAELEVSPRTVMRDIEALSGSGVPVYAVRGSNGGYELLDGFDRELPTIPTATGLPRGRISRVRVRLSPPALQMAALLGRPEGWRARPGSEPPAGREDWVEGSVRAESYDSALRELLALGPGVEVLLPIALREAMAEAGRHLVELHTADPEPGGRP